MAARNIRIISADDVPANRKRGGETRAVLSPATCGATSGFMGTARLQPGSGSPSTTTRTARSSCCSSAAS